MSKKSSYSFTLANRMSEIFGRRSLAVFLVLMALIWGSVFLLPDSLKTWENYLFDFKQRIAAGFRSPRPELVLVAIDMKTLASMKKRWPWPREEMAAFIDMVAGYRPRGIVLDIVFQNEDTSQGDKALAKAIKASGNVLLVSILEEKKGEYGTGLQHFSSHTGIAEAALGQGFVWGIIDSDGVQRNFRLFDDRLMVNSMPLEISRKFFPDLQKKSLPAIAPVVYGKKDGGIPQISALEIFEKKTGIEKFLKDRILVIGVTAPIIHDYHNTSLGRTAGAEILASSIDTVLSGRIGLNLQKSIFWRALASIAGAMLTVLLISKGVKSWLQPVILITVLALIMALSEIFLFHLPLAPFIFSALLFALVNFAGRYIDQLFALQTMRYEAENARLVQEQLFPMEKLSFADFSVYGYSKSADEIGGDYFDYTIINEKYLLVFVGDATGHGISAALAVSIVKAALLSAVNQKLTPEETIASINQILFQSIKRKVLMTAALISLDTETGDFNYFNCGHPYPYRIEKNGNISMLEAGGFFLGRKLDYKVKEPFSGRLEKGQRLVLYTDGIIEAYPGATEGDGFELFKGYLAEKSDADIEKFCHSILEKHPFYQTGAGQPDDFTVLVIERQ